MTVELIHGDCLDVLKTLDALQGHAFHNDSQVGILHAVRLDDKTNPRVEVEISPL